MCYSKIRRKRISRYLKPEIYNNGAATLRRVHILKCLRPSTHYPPTSNHLKPCSHLPLPATTHLLPTPLPPPPNHNLFHSSSLTVPYSSFPTPRTLHSPRFNVHSPLFIPHYLFPTIYSPLFIPHYLFPTIHSPLFIPVP